VVIFLAISFGEDMRAIVIKVMFFFYYSDRYKKEGCEAPFFFDFMLDIF